MIEIPLKPKNDDEFTTLKKGDKEIIVYSVLCQTDNQTAFVRFHPEYAVSVGKNSPKYALSEVGRRECKNFWSYPKNRAYRESYEATLAEFLGRKQTTSSTDVVEVDSDRRDKALKSLLSQAMSLVEGGADLDADSLKVVTDIFSKLGFIKGEEEREIKPLRFLPERCGSCRARIFVESAVANGEVLDMCQYCKARRSAEENGYRFESNNLLDIPKEVIAEIEAKNDVKVSDILSGKVEN